jgi:hypothetical protein
VTVKSREKQKNQNGGAPDEECIVRRIPIGESLFFSGHESEKTAEKYHSCATKGRKELA